MALLLALFASSAFAQSIDELPLYKETSHFKLYCTAVDQVVSDDMLNHLEILFEKLSYEFEHNYSKKISFYVYPDLASFHQAIDCPDAADWVGSYVNENVIKTVSPNNPGPIHNYNSVMKSKELGLVAVFIYNKYPKHGFIPRWLHQGVGLYKANYFSSNTLKSLDKNIDALPALKQLESINKEDDVAFNNANGFQVSQSLVQFMYEKWGWNSILALLEDYSKFEEILNVNKEEFHAQWIEFIKAK
jgi:hypothetical protein